MHVDWGMADCLRLRPFTYTPDTEMVVTGLLPVDLLVKVLTTAAEDQRRCVYGGATYHHLALLVKASMICRSWQAGAQQAGKELLTSLSFLAGEVPDQLLSSTRARTMTAGIVELCMQLPDVHRFPGLTGFLHGCVALKTIHASDIRNRKDAELLCPTRLGAAIAGLPGLERLSCTDFVPSALLPHSLQRLEVRLTTPLARDELSRRLTLLIIGLQAAPQLRQLCLDVETETGFSLKASRLAGAVLPQLQELHMSVSAPQFENYGRRFHFDDNLSLNLTWLGDAQRNFVLRLRLSFTCNWPHIKMLQRTLHRGDCLHWLSPYFCGDCHCLGDRMSLAELTLEAFK